MLSLRLCARVPVGRAFQTKPLHAKSIMVSRLPFSANEENVRAAFSTVGQVELVTIIQDKITRRSRGFGFVRFTNDMDADNCIGKTVLVDGRAVQCKPALREDPKKGQESKS
eukprot:TRINITY_DN10702_c0_g1_i1.p1 TRINITY_DN10702_c0_g1~~TRINITY_DN10702_c0_g1_i1.p1  ORF type:complete len:112 (+),score=10.44 TRINITY_DN10702_c0_g1_i1:195-530(+)